MAVERTATKPEIIAACVKCGGGYVHLNPALHDPRCGYRGCFGGKVRRLFSPVPADEWDTS